MKKLVLFAAIALVAASTSLTSAQAKPGGGGIGQVGGIGQGGGFGGGVKGGGGGRGIPKNPGCCGGWTGNKGWGGGFGGGFGGGISIGLVNNSVGDDDCYYVRRAVLVPGIGVVNRRQLVCE